MALEIIEHPEIGKVYLVRRRVGGNAKSRFEPAMILDHQPSNGQISLNKVKIDCHVMKVQWAYDQTIEDNYPHFDGFVRELSRKWLLAEVDRVRDETLALQTSAQALYKLM